MEIVNSLNSLGNTLTGHLNTLSTDAHFGSQQQQQQQQQQQSQSQQQQSPHAEGSGPSMQNPLGIGDASRSAGDVSNALQDIFKTTLSEADSYLTLFEARVKLEEEYVRGLRNMTEKAKDSIARLDAKIASSMSLGAGGAELPKARLAWKEIRENHLREIDSRTQYIDALRQGVIAPLNAYRDSQERIRKRIKDDLKTSIGAYDDMRQSTLPKAKKAYEKRYDEMDQLRLQQIAVEEQKLLLSQTGMHRDGSQSSHHADRRTSWNAATDDADDADTQDDHDAARGHNSHSRRHSAKFQSKASKSSGSDGAGEATGRQSTSSGVSPRFQESQLSTSPPLGSERKGHFFDAIRSKETWENARKEGPKKLNALLSRMREGGSSSTHDRGIEQNAPTASAATLEPGSPPHQGLGVNLGSGPGSLKSNQNVAIKHVKAKREAEEADQAYRKAVFDLETLRMRRKKTIAAAKASVIDARKELYYTCQAAWERSERSLQVLTNSQLGFSLHAEDLIKACLDNLDDELRRIDQRVPNVEDERITYVNAQFGECKDLLFGVSLVDYAFNRAQQAPPHLGPPQAEAPVLVQKCISFIERRALDQPGIYRTSAKHTAIQNIAHAIERDEQRFSFNDKDEPATVAGVLKLYLRQLPEPVLSMPWEERIRYTHERQEHIQTGFASLKGRIRRLPAINQATLKAIVMHLARVAAHAEQNKMTPSNLSIIFGPLLLSQADHETTSIAAAMEEDRVTEDLILYADTIFDLSRAGAPVLPSLQTTNNAHFSVDSVEGTYERPQRPVAAESASVLSHETTKGSASEAQKNRLNDVTSLPSNVEVPLAAANVDAGTYAKDGVRSPPRTTSVLSTAEQAYLPPVSSLQLQDVRPPLPQVPPRSELSALHIGGNQLQDDSRNASLSVTPIDNSTAPTPVTAVSSANASMGHDQQQEAT